MSIAQGVTARTDVTRLRVSYVATRTHDMLDVVGDPARFEALLHAPAPVSGLDLTLPYVDRVHTPVDADVWSMVAEVRLVGPVSKEGVRKLRKQAVPLRVRATLSVDSDALGGEPPYIDIHVHPFGVVGIATAELVWAEPQPLESAWSEVVKVQQLPASVRVAGGTGQATLAEAAGVAAEHVVGVLATHGGTARQIPDFRVATVIDGTTTPLPTAMPVAASPMHVALHHLSGGGNQPAPPANAFVPIWSGGGFVYSPHRLAYMVDTGAAIWGTPGPQDVQELTLGQQHRRLTLLLAHLTASIALIDASTSSGSAGFTSWARNAALRLSRLYGPSSPKHGIEPQRYLDQCSLRSAVESILGKQLLANTREYPLPPYV